MYNNIENYLSPEWKHILEDEFNKDYLINLKKKLNNTDTIIYPPIENIFRSLNLCSPDNIKVVILGQDCYHGPGQANGLSFSVSPGIKIPSSLQNIFKEIKNNYPDFTYTSGDLTSWANQGVLLLNSSLTVSKGLANSHLKYGWTQLTDYILKWISNNKKNTVFMLWGKIAQKKINLLETSNNYILVAPHPSGLSAHKGFIGCQHFKLCNEYLKSHGKLEINWCV